MIKGGRSVGTALVTANRTRGLVAQGQVLEKMLAAGRTVRPGTYRRVPGFARGRTADIEEVDEIGNVIRYFEVKSGNYCYGGLQKAKDVATEEITGIPTIVIRVPGRP